MHSCWRMSRAVVQVHGMSAGVWWLLAARQRRMLVSSVAS